MKSKYIIFFILLMFFFIIIYIFDKSGNNIIRQQTIIEKILNVENYNAKAKVTVIGNKTTNIYYIEFEENIKDGYSFERVNDCDNEELFTIESKKNKLTIKNSILDLSKIYENYEQLSKNNFFLSNFISKADFNNYLEKENEIIIKTNDGSSLHNQKLYINKEKNKIEKLEILDDEQRIKIIIEYINLEIN